MWVVFFHSLSAISQTMVGISPGQLCRRYLRFWLSGFDEQGMFNPSGLAYLEFPDGAWGIGQHS